MSVDYYFTAAFGVAGEFKDPGDLPGKLKGTDWEDLYEGNVSGVSLPAQVKLDIGGNQMCGPRRWSLTVGAEVRCDKRGMNSMVGDLPGVTVLEEPSELVVAILRKAMYDLDIEGTPSWMFLVDVS